MLKKIARNIEPKYLNPGTIHTGVVLGTSIENNVEVSYIVTKLFYRTSDYAIFEVNNSGYVEYISIDDDLYNTQAISLPLNRIIFWLYDTPKPNFYGFQESFSDSMALCFEGKPNEALFSIAQLEAVVKSEVFKNSKLIYLSTFAGFCFLLTLTSLLFRYVDRAHQLDENFKQIFYLCTMGSLGGLLSVSRNLDNYHVEIKSKTSFWATIWGPHLVGVVTRLTVAILGAFFIYILVRAGLLSTINVNKNFHLMLAMATIAGFSESFIPGLLTKFETNISAGEPLRVEQKNTQTASLGPAALNPIASSLPNTPAQPVKPVPATDEDDKAEG